MANSAKRRSAYHWSQQGDAVEIDRRTGSNAVAGFLAFWLAGWTAACAFVVFAAGREPKLVSLAAAAVVCAGWVFGFVALVGQAFGRESIRLDRDGVTIAQRAVVGTRRRVPLAEIRRFASARDATASDGRAAGKKQIELRGVGRPIRFGAGLDDDDVCELVDRLNEHLKRLRKSTPLASPFPPDAEIVVFRRRLAGELLADRDARTERTPDDAPLKPPSDTRIRHRRDVDAVRFAGRGRFTAGGTLGMLLLNVFWNGITGVFVYNLWWDEPSRMPRGLEWIWRFLLLLPFELIGLLMFFGLTLVIVEPLRVRSRRFSRNEIVDSLTWFGVGFRTKYAVDKLDRIEVRRVPYKNYKFPERLPTATLWAPEGTPTYSLVPVEPPGRDVCRIEGLTFGEACWMADVLLRERNEWFD